MMHRGQQQTPTHSNRSPEWFRGHRVKHFLFSTILQKYILTMKKFQISFVQSLLLLILFFEKEEETVATFSYKYTSTEINKRSIGHTAHLRNQFKSINTYAHIITLIWRGKKSSIFFFAIKCSESLYVKPSVSFSQGCFVSIWLKLAEWFCRWRFFHFVNIFSLFLFL